MTGHVASVRQLHHFLEKLFSFTLRQLFEDFGDPIFGPWRPAGITWFEGPAPNLALHQFLLRRQFQFQI
jgi:hypothetical protein